MIFFICESSEEYAHLNVPHIEVGMAEISDPSLPGEALRIKKAALSDIQGVMTGQHNSPLTTVAPYMPPEIVQEKLADIHQKVESDIQQLVPKNSRVLHLAIPDALATRVGCDVEISTTIQGLDLQPLTSIEEMNIFEYRLGLWPSSKPCDLLHRVMPAPPLPCPHGQDCPMYRRIDAMVRSVGCTIDLCNPELIEPWKNFLCQRHDDEVDVKPLPVILRARCLMHPIIGKILLPSNIKRIRMPLEDHELEGRSLVLDISVQGQSYLIASRRKRDTELRNERGEAVMTMALLSLFCPSIAASIDDIDFDVLPFLAGK